MTRLDETLTIGNDVVEFIRPYFELFKNDGFAPALSLGLLVLASTFALIFLFGYVLPIRWELWRKTLIVRRIKNNEDFAREMHAIEEAMTKRRLLRHSWREFRETLIEPNVARGDALTVRNTSRPHDYFNVQEAGLQFRFFRALPNFFVGLGLLLTFFGLVSALYFATQGISAGASVAETQAALRDLLHAASFKFYTSVAGLTASIALGLLFRWGTGFIENGFDSLAEALEERLLFITPESIAYDQSIEAKKQTEYLKLFTTDVAISVGRYVEEALNKTLPVHLANAMEPVARKLEQVTGNLTRMNEDALKSMADGFGEKLQGTAGDQIKALAVVLHDLKGSLDGISTRMNSSGEELAERIHQSSDEMRVAVSAMVGAINEIAAKVEGGAARSSEAIDRQLEATQQVIAQLSEKIAASIEATSQRLAQGSEDAAAKFSAEIAKAAAAAGVEAKAVIKAAADQTTDSLRAGAGEFSSSVQEIADAMDRAAHEMHEVEKSLVAHRSAIEGATGTARDTEAAMAGAARAIRDATAPLAIAGQTMAESSRRIGEAIDGAVTSIQASEERTRALADRISSTLEQVTRTWADYEQRFAGVDKSLEEALGKMMGYVQTSMDTMQKYVLELDNKLAETIDRLGGGIEELSEFSENIEKAVVELKTSIDRMAPVA